MRLTKEIRTIVCLTLFTLSGCATIGERAGDRLEPAVVKYCSKSTPLSQAAARVLITEHLEPLLVGYCAAPNKDILGDAFSQEVAPHRVVVGCVPLTIKIECAE